MSFKEFYSEYLNEHSRTGTRVFHFVGVWVLLAAIVTAFLRQEPWWVPGGIGLAYGLGWTGHFLVEKNKPTTLRGPSAAFFSVFAFFRLFLDLLIQREKF
jgi:hypothetical protein